MTTNLTLAAALQYAEEGLPVFPCRNQPDDPDQHKKPLTKNGFKDAATDARTIRRWWTRWPNALIGMPTGTKTGIAVLDLDVKRNKDGFAAVPDWEQRSPVIARTQSGGAHLYFQAAGAPGCTSDQIATGVDTRGDGGYVIVAPSPGYSWVDGADFSALPPWPDDLRPPSRDAARATGVNSEAEPTLVAAALRVIPNDDLGWDEWNRVGMATWRATRGSDKGLAEFMAWSKKSKKFDADVTAKRWRHYTSSPPNRVGAGTLFREASTADPGWRARELATTIFPDVNKQGWPRATLPNTKVALTLLEIECKHDLFKLRYLVEGHQIESYVGEVSDPALLRLREIIHEQFGFDPVTQTVHTAVQTLANHHRFHPVRDYLDGLNWDGVPRIDNWLIIYGGAEDSLYVRAVGALVLLAAVRRVRQPGCKFDEMLVLENPEQGTNKSQALAVLAVRPEWFSDNLPLGLSAKETIEAVSGHWIVEASELHGMRNSDIDKVKAFVSRDTDRARMAYDRAVTEARRQCVIIGTTNNEQYLRDRTGNRRFWPVRVGRFDLEALKRDRDQLWAEAAKREASGASIRLPEKLWPAAAREQEQRVIENPFVGVLDQVLREDAGEGEPMEGKITPEELWNALQIRPAQRTQQQFENLGDAMKQLGWERRRLRAGGGNRRSYFYVKPNEEPEEGYRRIEIVLISQTEGGQPSLVATYVDPDKPAF